MRFRSRRQALQMKLNLIQVSNLIQVRHLTGAATLTSMLHLGFNSKQQYLINSSTLLSCVNVACN